MQTIKSSKNELKLMIKKRRKSSIDLNPSLILEQSKKDRASGIQEKDLDFISISNRLEKLRTITDDHLFKLKQFDWEIEKIIKRVCFKG